MSDDSEEYAFLEAAGARQALSAQVARVRARPARIAVLFPAAARSVARGPGPSGDPDGVSGPTLEDLVRVELLIALAESLAPPDLAQEVHDLYHHGDAGERRAVLRGLGRVWRTHTLPRDAPAQPSLRSHQSTANPGLTPSSALREPHWIRRSRRAASTKHTPNALDTDREELASLARELLADAMRTNDTRLVAAAASSEATALLDAHSWRQGVLKCLFVEVPLESAAGIPERADDELARMCADFARERAVAGRPVPDDVHLVLKYFPRQTARLNTDRTEA